MEAIRLETRMPDNPFFAEYVMGIYNFLEIESSLLESIQDLNFRFGIHTKVQQGLKIQVLKKFNFTIGPKTVKMVNHQINFLCYVP